jgi:hypothetical protein
VEGTHVSPTRSQLLARALVLVHTDVHWRAWVLSSASPLGDDDKALLARVDVRAFQTDPLRKARLLHTLAAEFPVSCAVVGLATAAAFFVDDDFAQAVLSRQRLVDAFSTHMGPRVGDVARLELAVAAARRRRVRVQAGGVLRATGVEVVDVTHGTLVHYAAARAQLGADPVAALVEGATVARAVAHDDSEHVLVTPGAHGAQEPDLSLCSMELARLLQFVDVEKPLDAVLACARTLGADAGDDLELCRSLRDDGLLCASTSLALS